MVSSSQCTLYYTDDECKSMFGPNYNQELQQKIQTPILWIGVYTAAASAACSLAMAADIINALRIKKLWVPCKAFSLNAFSLTVLAVAMKLPVDLTTRMPAINDKLARLSSLVLMCTAMANFMPSLGSMANSEIPLNLAALATLVVTVAGNVFIHVLELRNFYVSWVTAGEKTLSTLVMLLLLGTLSSSGVMVPTARRYLESRYKQMHERIISSGENLTASERLRVAVRRYWVMAESRAPQFVVARSAACAPTGALSLLAALTLVEALVRLSLVYRDARRTSTSYKWSVNWILGIQTAGMALGTVAPLLRWFMAARLKSTEIGRRSLRGELRVEAYWIQILKDWRDRPLPLRSGHHRFRKAVHDTKRVLLNLCIWAQILTVCASKLVLLISAVFLRGLTCCIRRFDTSVGPDEETWARTDPDLGLYVLLLEGEAELPEHTVAAMCRVADGLIETGRRRKFRKLIELLGKSDGFEGVWEFDSGEIHSLNSREPPNCWALPIVTLTSIGLSLGDGHSANWLLAAVSQGLYFVKIIEKALDPNGKLVTARNVADAVWLRLELYRKWRGEDLKRRSVDGGGTLRRLSGAAERAVRDFAADPANGFLAQDPLNWPAKVIAANSMYRITQTLILGAHEDDNDERVFERVSIMISDIVAACLTNLAHVISLECYSEESMERAARLLGESEEVLQALERRREVPGVGPDKAGSVDGWRAFAEQECGNRMDS